MNIKLHIGFLIMGRLTSEKGIDLVLEVIESLIHDKKAGYNQRIDQMQFFVFGEGIYKERLMQLANEAHVHVFGRQSLDIIKRYLPSCQYTLMPSQFLETFGKSALDALAMGLPVIGFAKGGLEQFVDPELDISQAFGATDTEKLKHLLIETVKMYHPDHQQTLVQQAQLHAQKYSQKHWLAHFKTLPIQGKRILMVTDFSTQLGGIETYCHETKTLLSQAGYQVQLQGLDVSVWWGKLLKNLGLALAFFNVIAAVQLRWEIRTFRPTTVWFHSVLRYQGWLSLLVARMMSVKIVWMMHDFGYLVPYPSQLFQTGQLPKKWTLKSFAVGYKTWRRGLIMIKYGLLSLIWSQLRKSDLILVPSEFMKPLIVKYFPELEENIDVLPHFTTLVTDEKNS